MRVTFDLPPMTRDQLRTVEQAAREPDARIEVVGTVSRIDTFTREGNIECEGSTLSIETQRHGRMMVVIEHEGRTSPRPRSLSPRLSESHLHTRERLSPPRLRRSPSWDDPYRSPFRGLADWAQ